MKKYKEYFIAQHCWFNMDFFDINGRCGTLKEAEEIINQHKSNEQQYQNYNSKEHKYRIIKVEETIVRGIENETN